MSKRGIHAAVAVVFIPLLLLAIVACSNDDDGASSVATAVGGVGGAESELCQKLGDLETAVAETDSLSASSTVDDAKESMSEVKDATEAVRQAAAGVAEAQLNLIQTAQGSLESALNNISGDQTLGQAATAIRAQTGTIARTIDGIQSDRGCP